MRKVPVFITGVGFMVCVVLGGVLSTGWQNASAQAANAENPSYQKITAQVPVDLQKHLYEQLVNLAVAVYPDANAALIRDDMKGRLLQKEQVFGVSKATGISAIINNDGCKSDINCSFDIPVSRLSVGKWEVPVRTQAGDGKNALTEKEARAIAEEVIGRVAAGSNVGKRGVMTSKGMDRDGRYYVFELDPGEGSEGGAVFGRVAVIVRKKDGIVQEVIKYFRDVQEKPKLSREELVKMAKSAIKDFDPAHLKRTTLTYYTSMADVWQYEVPPGTYGLPKDKTIWSTQTGKLLYSEVIGGGTSAKPYRDPEFYFVATENAIKERLEKVLADVAAAVTSGQPQGGT